MTSKNQTGWKSWLEKSPKEQEPKILEQLWSASKNYQESYEPNVEAGLEKLKARIKADQTKVVTMQPRRTWLRIAAAVVILVAAGFVVQNLFNGSNLETVFTENSPKEIRLGDGTVVTLNANSSLSFPKTFDKDIRKVSIKGEGFFDVQKNPEKPFIVETDFGNITVLGTAFNVRCLETEKNEVIHVEHGKVAYTSKSSRDEKILTKADKGILTKENGQIQVLNDKRYNSFSWRTRKLSFYGNSLKEIFEQVSENLNIEFEVLDAEALKCKYTVDFNLNSVDEVLERLEVASGKLLKFEKTGKESYKVNGNGCLGQ